MTVYSIALYVREDEVQSSDCRTICAALANVVVLPACWKIQHYTHLRKDAQIYVAQL
jgi:hypothetical protein